MLHSLRARLTLSVQNDNIIVVVLMREMRFFAALRMTKTNAQNDNKRGLRMTIKKGAQNDNITGRDSSLRSE